MRRDIRLTINLFVPPLIAAILFSIHNLVVLMWERKLPGGMEALAWFLYIVVCAYIIGIIPAGGHTLLMERVYRRWPAETRSAVLASAGSGTLSGLLIATGFSLLYGFTLFLFFYVGIVGGLTGAIVAWIIRRTACRQKERIP
jgi:hypothetical protein